METFARVFLTAKDTEHRLCEVSRVPLQPHTWEDWLNYVFVDPHKQNQTVIGFGGALTDAAAETLAKLSEDKQQELITAYFDRDKGIGYSLGRVNINSCDFSSDMYTYCDEGDVSLRSFSLAHDLRYKIPFIKRALSATAGDLALFASPWSPPAWMKDNKDMLYGGKLLPKYRDAWARYFVKFIEHYAAEGIPLWGITVQNEPLASQTWESCIYTAEEERDFIRDHLGPMLHTSGHGRVKLIAWDHNRGVMYERARVILSDPGAAHYVWGIGYHWYCSESYENVSLVRESFPGTHLLFTEGCHGPYDRARLNEWWVGEMYGMALIQDMNRGCEGWCDWNILLDEYGGPNHVGNCCFAPVHADTEKNELIYTTP